MKKGEATRVIYLQDLLWLIAFWLDAEIYTIDARVSDLCYINFSSLAHEQICCYEIVKACYVLMIKIKTKPHTHL